MVTKKKKIPFDFILEYLHPYEPVIKPMFGAYGVYFEEKIVFILFEKPDHPEDSGLWLATDFQHHESLQKEFLEMRSIFLFGNDQTKWQNIPAQSDHFEEYARKACEMVLNKDPRIGRIPKPKKKKKK